MLAVEDAEIDTTRIAPSVPGLQSLFKRLDIKCRRYKFELLAPIERLF